MMTTGAAGSMMGRAWRRSFGSLIALAAAGALAQGAAARSAPSSSAAPTPAPAAVAPQLYTLGQLRWTFHGDAPAEKRTAITDAMDWAVNEANTLAAFPGDVTVVYNPATPTADANYESRIQFGGSISRRVALHELAHWLGSGTYERWDSTLADGVFRGPTAIARMAAFDGDTGVPHADHQHFWPYGLNHDHEFVEPQRNVQMVSAQRLDMALGDAAHAIDGERRFLNRAAPVVLAGAGTVPRAVAWRAGKMPSWQARYADGFVTLTDGRGRALGHAAAPSPAAALSPRTGDIGQQWEMIPTDAGWFQLRNRQSLSCLAADATIALQPCGDAPTQQWHLVR